MTDIHEYMAARVELAAYYAQDGAFRSAARVFADLAETLPDRADEIDAALAEASEGA